MSKRWFLVIPSVALLALTVAVVAAGSTGQDKGVQFTDVKKQTEEFIGYNTSIKLTPEQEAVKKEALTAIPAPCCSDNSAYTCCCPCNMARAIWGLSNYLIAEQGYGAAEVREKVSEWVRFINPSGFSGDVCYSAGGCARPFAKNGCGGMQAGHVAW